MLFKIDTHIQFCNQYIDKQSAESHIRDTDMAKEIMNYTKNTILMQASQTMLAQSNKHPEAILQFLQ